MTGPSRSPATDPATARLPGTPDPAHLWIGTDGIRIAADSYGDPSAPLVILLHGGGQTRLAWRRTGQELASAGLYVVAFDARGHGDSDWPPDGDYSQTMLARDLDTVAAQVGARPAVLVGASMGGMTALVAAAERGFPARAIALLDVAPRTEERGYRRIQSFLEEGSDGFGSIDEAAASVARFRGGAAAPGNPAGLARSLRRTPQGRLRWHWDPRLLDSRHAELPTREARLADCVRRIGIPMLLLRGETSDFVSRQGVAHFLSLSPHAAHIEVPGAGHMITSDKNDAFGAALRDFVRHHAEARQEGMG